MIEKIISTFGRIDILVNNAGITRDQLTVRMSDEEWDAVLNINLKSVFLCTRAALRYMMKQRWGRIINISSIFGIVGNPGTGQLQRRQSRYYRYYPDGSQGNGFPSDYR